jgi:hypothetical protein
VGDPPGDLLPGIRRLDETVHRRGEFGRSESAPLQDLLGAPAARLVGEGRVRVPGQGEDNTRREGDTDVVEDRQTVAATHRDADDDEVELAAVPNPQCVRDRTRDDRLDGERERGDEAPDTDRVVVDDEDLDLAPAGTLPCRDSDPPFDYLYLTTCT